MPRRIVTVSSDSLHGDKDSCELLAGEIQDHFGHVWDLELSISNMFVTANGLQAWNFSAIIDTDKHGILKPDAKNNFKIADRGYSFYIQVGHMYSLDSNFSTFDC